MDDGAGRTLDGLKRLTDDVVAALGQHLDGDILGDAVAVDELAQELVLSLAGGRETNLDLLEADLDQHIVEFQLFVQAHRDDQALVAVAQVHAAPGRGLFDVVLFGPLIHMAGLDRWRIIPYMILGCVHHNKNASFKAVKPLEEVNKKPSPKGGLPLRDGSKFTVAVPAVPLSLSLMRPLCTISEFA